MIPTTKPVLGEKEAAATQEVILFGWVTQGPKVKAFEEAFAQVEIQSSKFKVQNVRLGRVAAILPVHQMGIPCDIARILAIAKECDLPVVEDAACAIESEISLDAYSAKEVKSYIMLLRGTVTENNLSIISKGYVI